MEIDIKNMPTFEKRKLVKSGASYVVSIPRKWLEENDLTEGGDIIVKANGELKIEVANKENINKMNQQIENIRNQLSHSVQSSAMESNEAAADSG